MGSLSGRGGRSLVCSLFAVTMVVACFEDDPPAAQPAGPPPAPPVPACVPQACVPFPLAAAGVQCGSGPDGCGHTLYCGDCSSSLFACIANRCTRACIQGCPDGATCQPDGTCRSANGPTGLHFDEELVWADLDVMLDGKKPATCTARGSLLATLELLDVAHERSARIPVQCAGAGTWTVRAPIPFGASYTVKLVPGDVTGVLPVDDATISGTFGFGPNDRATIPHDLDTPMPLVPKLALNLTSSPTTFTGELRVEGATPTKDLAACAQRPDQVLARITLTSKLPSQNREYAIRCSSPDWKFTTDVPAGAYGFTVEPVADALRYYGVNLEPIRTTFPLRNLGGSSQFVLDEVGVRLSGQLRVNGAPLPPPPAATCDGSPFSLAYDFGYLELSDPKGGVTARVPLGCNSAWSYDVRLPAAPSYTAKFVPGYFASAVKELPSAPVSLPGSVALAADTIFNPNMSLVDVTLDLASNGQPLRASAFCSTNPGGLVGDLHIYGAAGASTTLAVCSMPDLKPQLRLAPGQYRFALAPRPDLDTGLGGSATAYVFAPVSVAPAGASIALPSQNVPVFVSPTIESKPPTFDPGWCKANPMVPIADVTAVEKSTGLSLSAGLTCASNSVRFDVPPGTYDFAFQLGTAAQGSNTNVSAAPTRKLGVAVLSSSNVTLDTPELVPVDGDLLLGSIPVAVGPNECGRRNEPVLLLTRFNEPTLGYDFTSETLCAAGYRIQQKLPPGTWNAYVVAPAPSPSSAGTAYLAPYEYQVARKLVVPSARK